MYFNEGLSAPFDHAFTMTTTILKPTSRGSVTLRSARPDAKPRIHHNYLATEDDRWVSGHDWQRAFPYEGPSSFCCIRLFAEAGCGQSHLWRAAYVGRRGTHGSGISKGKVRRRRTIIRKESTCLNC